MADPTPGASQFLLPSPQSTGWIIEQQANGVFKATFIGDVTITGTLAAIISIVFAAGDRILGRVGTPGAAQELTVSGGLEFSGAGIRRSALTGDVAAAAGSNATAIQSNVITNAMIQTGQISFNRLVSSAIATASEFFSNTASKLLSATGIWNAAVPVVIPFNAAQALDFGTFINGTLAPTDNFTLQAPTNLKPGQSGCIEITQDGVGSRTMNSTNAAYVWAGGTDGVLSTAPAARDLLFYEVLADSKVYLSLVKAVT